MPPKQVKAKKRSTAAPTGNAVGLAVVAGATALAIWWRRRSSGAGRSSSTSGGRSAFRFPGKRGGTATTAPAGGSATPVARPPGPPGSHKKKSKAQKAADRAARAGKRDAAVVAADVDKARRDPKDPNNTLILNYSYYDSARRDTANAARAQQQK